MKVLQIVHQFLPMTVGGTQIYTSNLCKELNKTFNIRLLFTRVDRRKKQYCIRKGEYNGIPFTEIIRNHYCRDFIETYQDPTMDGIFIRELEEFKPDIIHIQHLLYLSINFIKIVRNYNIPVVFTLHDFWLMCPRWGRRRRDDNTLCFHIDENICAMCLMNTAIIPSKLDKIGFAIMELLSDRTVTNEVTPHLKHTQSSTRSFIIKSYKNISKFFKPIMYGELPQQIRDRLLKIRELCSLVNLFVTPTRFLKEDAMKILGIPEDKIIYSPHGLSIFHYRLYQKKGSPNLRFGYVGQLAEHKGVHILVDAFNRVNIDNTVLNIFGDFTDSFMQSYIVRLKKSIKNQNIRLCGGFEPCEITKIFSEIDVLVVPSIWFETFSIVIHEAFALGVPVIATDIGAMGEVVRHGKDGLLFKVGDVDDLYEKIKMLIDNRQLIDKLAEGIKPLKTIEQDAKDFETRYLSLLNRT